MLTNYLLVAVRHLRRNKVFSLVNLAGLSIGLATFLVIVIFATFHKNFDTYHEDADRIVRLGMRVRLGGELVTLPTVGAPAARAFVNDIPEVEAATRIYGRGTFHFEVKNGDKVFSGEQGLFADPNFFNFFSIPIKAGSNSAMLTEPKSIVLTEDMVQKYFGEGTTNESVIGRVLEITNIGQVTVTAVCANVPAQTHFNFDMLLSGDCNPENENPFWLANGFHTYVKLIPGSPDASLHSKFPDFADKYIGPEITQFLGVSFSEFLSSGGSFEFTTMPMRDIHLWSHAENELAVNVNGTYINLFLVIGFLILLLAVINFVNLSAASNIQRMKEVGVRKVMGAQKGALVFQFITESVLITFVAFCLGLTIQQAATPYLSQYYGMQMGLESMSLGLYLSIAMAGCLFIGTVAGLYPAILLSSAKTTLALKGQVSAQSTRSKMRNTLLVIQFCITIGLISSVLVILAQVNYLQTKELGFQKDGILLISGIDRLEQSAATLRHELAKLPGAEAVSITNFVPSGPHEYERNAMQNPEQENPETFRVTHVGVDEHYLGAMKMKLLAGRNFSAEFGDEASHVIINAAMCRKYGWDVASGEALGKTVVEVDHNTPFKVIGVVEDFHIFNMTEPISPFFFRYSPDGFLAVIRFKAENASVLQTGIDSFLVDFTQVELTQSFLGDHFLRNFEEEQRVSSLFEMFALLAIVLSGMGLFAMTAFVTYQRTKEIGIRKVLGARGWQLFWMLSRQVVVMIALASVIATPVVYHGMDRWLQEYAYRIQVPIWAIALPLVGMIAFALVVSGSHILKVININPVESLRDE